MNQSDSADQPVAIVLNQERSFSLRIDEQIHQEAREYLLAGMQGSPNSHRAFQAVFGLVSAERL